MLEDIVHLQCYHGICGLSQGRASSHRLFDCRDDELAETSDPATLVYDSATRMFWRNVNARSGNAPVNKLGRKPARYDIPEEVPVPPAVELLGEVMLQPDCT